MNPDRVATLVSVLGVVLTTASVIASVAQYRAADLQAQAAVVALMPQLEVRSLLEKADDNSEKFTDRRIEITSDGGPVYNLKVDRYTWFELRIGRKAMFQQPLVGYYFAAYPTSHTKGATYTLKGHRNHEAFIAFAKWARGVLGQNVDLSEPITLLRISYRDALKRDDVEFVRVSGGSEVYLSEDDGQKLWQQRTENEKLDRAIDIIDLVSAQAANEWITIWKAKLGV